MPKRKTRKSAHKRFKITKNGRVVHERTGRVISGRIGKRIRRMLGK